MRSFATVAILALVAVAAVNAQWFSDDGFDDYFDDDDDDYRIYMGGYAPSAGFGPLSSGYVMGSMGSVGMGSVGMGSMGSSIAYSHGHGGKSGKAMYIPYAVPTPVAAQPTPLPLELLYGNVQTTQGGLLGGNGSGLLCK